jgi:hypothetical protein
MAIDLRNFDDGDLDALYVEHLLDCHDAASARFERLWSYFRNELIETPAPDGRPYAQAQEAGLPPRITGAARAPAELTDVRRKEVVIENDIAWRVHTMVDFLFGKPPVLRSLAGDARTARAVEAAMAGLLESSGGIALLQDAALLGAVYGFVDIALRAPADGSADTSSPRMAILSLPSASADRRPATPDHAAAFEAGASLQLEAVAATRVLAIAHEDDCRRLRYWVQRFHKFPPRLAASARPWWSLGKQPASQAVVETVEIIGPTWWQRYDDRKLVAQGPNALGRVPVVHVQNLPLAGSYEGLSDVEPLVPLQDELNTRLSDRANRVTYQSFKMYLGKGIDDFLERPVGPGQMWATHNLDASIEEFGSDPGSPSEDAHIDQVRQALDKTSAVTPLAAGLIRGSVGNLTSAAALKVLLSGLLARTARKRLTYGAALAQVAELALDHLDRVGLLHTLPHQRRIEVHWPDPLPADETQQLRNAQIKAALGLPPHRVLAELGYDLQSSQENAQ